MEKNISTQELRAALADAIDAVQQRGDRFVIEHRGKPVAALVPIGVNEAHKRNREEFVAAWRDMQASADLSREEAEELAASEVQGVRASRKKSGKNKRQ